MKILCRFGLHRWKVWYEDDIITEEYCTICGEKRSIVEIHSKYGRFGPTPSYKPSLKDKRRKKLAKIKLNNVLNRKKL